MSENDKTFVIYFVELCSYNNPNVINDVQTKKFTSNRKFHLVTRRNVTRMKPVLSERFSFAVVVVK